MERVTDSELLSAYACRGSESAFDQLVGRHAPKVFAAAMRVLGDPGLAEDASQATFLLLARKAGAVAKGPSVSGWVFRTAGYIALRAARARSRRSVREEAAVRLRPESVPDPEKQRAWRELAPELDAAVAELPAGYRDAVVLRYVDGLSQRETARELGITESAVSLRTMRGLERLREKLAQRRVVLSTSLLAMLVTECGASLDPRLLGTGVELDALVSSIRAVCRGTAEASSSAKAMMEEAMRAMRWRKLRVVAAAAAVLVCAALIAPFGVSAWAGGEKPVVGSQAEAPAPKPKPAPTGAAAVVPKPVAAPKRVAATTKQKQEVVREANAFAFDLYAKVRAEEEQQGKNVFFSPFSISSALAMTYAGAGGRTAEQMAKVMHYDLKEQELHPAFSDLTANFNKRGKAGSFKLAVANRLWGQKDYRFLQNFLELNKLYYGAGIERVDFGGNTEGARKTINTWVEKKTEDKIKDLLQKGDLTGLTRLVLTNAIYFKGDWARQFEEKRTRVGDFTVSEGERVKVPMMNQTAKFPYMRGDGFQALELAYKGGELAMVVLLPDRNSSVDALEKKLNAKTVASSLAKLRTQQVIVGLPKFKMEWRLDLKKTLIGMGMVDAFSDRLADFSGMTGTRDLYIFKVIHKAFVAVDEVGTEAAAATAVVMTLRSAPRHPSFRADRPFVFLIRDRKTGSILFLGRVVNPKG